MNCFRHDAKGNYFWASEGLDGREDRTRRNDRDNGRIGRGIQDRKRREGQDKRVGGMNMKDNIKEKDRIDDAHGRRDGLRQGRSDSSKR